MFMFRGNLQGRWGMGCQLAYYKLHIRISKFVDAFHACSKNQEQLSYRPDRVFQEPCMKSVADPPSSGLQKQVLWGLEKTLQRLTGG
jgi:hypothetical protein